MITITHVNVHQQGGASFDLREHEGALGGLAAEKPAGEAAGKREDHAHGDHAHGDHAHGDHAHGDHAHGDHARAVAKPSAEPSQGKARAGSEATGPGNAAQGTNVPGQRAGATAGGPLKSTRSEAEAMTLAQSLVAELRKDPGRFAELARARSEDPMAASGGDLGTWTPGQQKELDEAILGLTVGAISEPFATDFGIRIYRREAPVVDTRVAARQLVVAWSGATRAPTSLTRTRAEALARAEALTTAAQRDPAGFEAQIRKESDGYDREKGGYLGAWTTNTGRYPPGYDRAVSALPEGGISAPVASDFGYLVFQRVAAPPAQVLLAGAHVLVSFQGAQKAKAGVKRSEAEALAEATRIVEEARQDPVRFGLIAAERSDDASGKRGGELGVFRKGTLPAALEEALEGLRIGEVGGPVRTPYGYHVVVRREAPTDREYVAQ
ncbi:peptidylprolyl isomerase [Chondromyces crocatus]|uniref:PpiC domain-containing protein n=1 Tax=Chondromyces crocatus TaxID=52 RepID=A0A0K1ES36_CHOCO|nr:peptidylprolyl isomerase [Chondromyces crocatus]AKT43599.1 uncharacterized protein CMC5_078340 [Chondromyces crocatus]